MENVPELTERAAAWIKDKILYGCYLTGLDDRILVERLLYTCLVPYQLEPRDRMMKLLYLYSTIDTNASKAFIAIQKNLLLYVKTKYYYYSTLIVSMNMFLTESNLILQCAAPRL